MPTGLVRNQQCGCLHFINFSCYHRSKNLDTPAARQLFERSYEAMRIRHEFVVAADCRVPHPFRIFPRKV